MTWNEKTDEKWSRPFREASWGAGFLVKWSQFLTAACYVLYPALLIWLFVQGGASFANEDCWRALLVPASGFVILTVVRKLINAPRPYEVLDIDPIIAKDTHGESFPSRHVFSCFVIAMAWLYYFWPVGVLLLLAGVDMALARVLGGVHWPRDVITAAAWAIIWALVGFWII